MKIINYSYKGVRDDWEFSDLRFKDINLIVGDTSTGKTRLLNTIFNLGRFIVSDNYKTSGIWDLKLEIEGVLYSYHLNTYKEENDDDIEIVNENLFDISGNEQRSIIERDKENFIYLGDELPKMKKDQTGINLLKEESEISSIYTGFTRIMSRRFYGDVISKSFEHSYVNLKHLKVIESEPTLEKLFNMDMSLNCKVHVLHKYFPDKFEEIVRLFKTAFPFVNKVAVKDLCEVDNCPVTGIPTLAITERNVVKWVSLTNFSSGMLKLLLLLTDVVALPDGAIYLIDEYENSLGASAINFFPILLEEMPSSVQYFITSHHPYIINKMDISNWIIFHRTGSKVSAKYGDDLKDKFSSSHQEKFLQLINDPFFSEGED